MENINTYTVAEVNKYVKKLLDNDFILSNIMVKGEISNFKNHSSGHLYFSLKDEFASMKCVMFKMQTFSLKFKPEDGMKVIIRGYISSYEKDGQCQLYCDSMTKDGIGDLYAEYEKLKEKLAKEGLFDESRKKKIPLFPKCVGVITSDTGAVIKDILNVSLRRFPKANIRLFPSAVQGEGAYKELARQINLINEKRLADVIIIGRGGGSLEDLWNFNSEELAYTISKSEIPVVSAVGHETDFTICDFVSDLRAPTPSAAAEMVFPQEDELLYKLGRMKNSLKNALNVSIMKKKKELMTLTGAYCFKRPKEIINRYYLLLDNLNKNMMSLYEKNMILRRNKFTLLLSKLDALSPVKTLMRGYAILEKDGDIIKSEKDVLAGEEFRIRLNDGEFLAKRKEWNKNGKEL